MQAACHTTSRDFPLTCHAQHLEMHRSQDCKLWFHGWSCIGKSWSQLQWYPDFKISIGKSLARVVCLYEPRISPGEILGSMCLPIRAKDFPWGNPWVEVSAYTSQGFPLGKSLGRSVCLYEPRISPGEILGSMYNCPDSKNFRLKIWFLLEFDLNFARIVQSVIWISWDN